LDGERPKQSSVVVQEQGEGEGENGGNSQETADFPTGENADKTSSAKGMTAEQSVGEMDDDAIREAIGLSEENLLPLLAAQEGRYNFDRLNKDEQLAYAEIYQILYRRERCEDYLYGYGKDRKSVSVCTQRPS